MWGEPKDVEGECNAHLYLADNYGDNHTTCRCQLPQGHAGAHMERFTRVGRWPEGERHVVITWEYDERPEREAEDDAMRGEDEARHEGIPMEPGEHYLAGFNDYVIDHTCAMCEVGVVTETDEYQDFKYGVGEEAVPLRALVPMMHCSSCGGEYTDWRGEDARQEAVDNYLLKKGAAK